jgi:hypothetical protein
MKKVIKEFKNGNLTYQLGYNPWRNKIFLRIEIYKDDELLSGGRWGNNARGGLFYFGFNYSTSETPCYLGSLTDMFIKLREYSEIPEEVEKEYERLFLLYKLNDFKKI